MANAWAKLITLMDYYERYPMMSPYVGRNFGVSVRPALLLIGASHYLDDDVPQRASAESWYSGNATTLDQRDIDFINTVALMNDSKDSRFSTQSHSIWRNSLSVINSVGPQYEDFCEVADDVAFFNLFLRPGLDGDSVAHELTDLDVRMANDAFACNIQRLKPTAIVFLSAEAFGQLRYELSVPHVATAHPCCKWWNLNAKKYGNRSGREVLSDFVTALAWNRA